MINTSAVLQKLEKLMFDFENYYLYIYMYVSRFFILLQPFTS